MRKLLIALISIFIGNVYASCLDTDIQSLAKDGNLKVNFKGNFKIRSTNQVWKTLERTSNYQYQELDVLIKTSMSLSFSELGSKKVLNVATVGGMYFELRKDFNLGRKLLAANKDPASYWDFLRYDLKNVDVDVKKVFFIHANSGSKVGVTIHRKKILVKNGVLNEGPEQNDRLITPSEFNSASKYLEFNCSDE